MTGTAEAIDRMHQRINELETSLDIIRQSELNTNTKEFQSRASTLQELLHREGFLFFQSLTLKKRLQELERIVQRDKFVNFRLKKLKESVADVSHRRELLSRELQVFIPTVYEDYREYEALVRSLLPASMLSRLQRLLPGPAEAESVHGTKQIENNLGSLSFVDKLSAPAGLRAPVPPESTTVIVPVKSFPVKPSPVLVDLPDFLTPHKPKHKHLLAVLPSPRHPADDEEEPLSV